MPKPVAELQRRQRPLDDRIIEVLQRDASVAYTPQEIAARAEAGENAGPATITATELAFLLMSEEEQSKVMAPWFAALNRLVSVGRVRTFKDGDITYYAALAP